MAPVLSTILRMAGRGGKLSDNFNRTLTGSLGSMSTGGSPWSIITGTWDVNGARPVTATSLSSNPLATVNPGLSDVETSLTLGAGDALYFRVQDATNWWRLLWYGWQTTSCQQCCSTCCSTCYNSCVSSSYGCHTSAPGYYCCGASYGCNEGCPPCGSPYSCQVENYACTYSCNPYSCNCYSCNCTSCNCVNYDNYQLRLEKMIAGTLTTVATGSTVATATVRAKAVLLGSNVTAYQGSTQVYSGAQTELAGVAKYGIGRGASSYNTSAMDDFEIIWK